MKIYNSIKLTSNGEHPTLSYFLMVGSLTISMGFNLFLYFFIENGEDRIIWINLIAYLIYFSSPFFLKNSILVLFKEFFSLVLLIMPFFLMFYYLGVYIIGSDNIYFPLILVYILVDFLWFFKLNKNNIYYIISGSLSNGVFDYGLREELRIKMNIERTPLAKVIAICGGIILVPAILLGKNLPYFFFASSSGDEFGLIVGIFVLSFIIAFFCLSYVYVLLMFLYFFIIQVYGK